MGGNREHSIQNLGFCFLLCDTGGHSSLDINILIYKIRTRTRAQPELWGKDSKCNLSEVE
jgi:hypothetical protein